MDATVLYRLYGGLLVDVQIVRRVGCTMPGRSRLLCKCAGSMSSQGMLSRRRISPPFKAREILNIKGLRVTRGRIKCSNTEEPYEYDTDGEETHKFELLPDVARGRVKSLSKSITQFAKELLPPMIPLVAETMATSVLISFLIGIVLSLDFVKLIKSHQTLLKVFQIDGFQFHQTITGSFTFVFLVSAAITALLGCMCIPFLRKLKAYQIFRKEGPSAHFSKVGTPTMGGLIFIPVGVTIAAVATHFASGQLNGLIAATLLFGAIGLLDDILGLIRKHNYGLPGLCKFCLQVFAGIWFYFWCESANLPTPFGVKTVVLLPLPFQHWNLGNWYLPFTAFCFASMSNGVNLTDGLDGLATGTAAAAFLGMALAVIHIYPDVAIFGVSMAGACVGFLVHNRHKAAVFMGDTGSLALGGALAAMAASTGMFLPLLICSGIFFVETVSVVLQVSYKRCTKKLTGVTKKLFRMAPIHHHFELGGVKEPTIVAAAHLISCLLALLGGYVGFKILGIGVAAM